MSSERNFWNKPKKWVEFIVKTLDSFVLLIVLVAVWYILGTFTKYYDPQAEMTVWTPMTPILFGLIVLIVSVLMSLIMLAIVFPKAYKTIIRALDGQNDVEESGLSKKESWYVSLLLFCFFVLMFILSVKII